MGGLSEADRLFQLLRPFGVGDASDESAERRPRIGDDVYSRAKPLLLCCASACGCGGSSSLFDITKRPNFTGVAQHFGQCCAAKCLLDLGQRCIKAPMERA